MAPTNQKSEVNKLYRSSPASHRKTMMEMRKRILEIVPEAQEVVSYGMPAFKVNGSVVAGLMAAKNHVGFYPFSGSVLPDLSDELKDFSRTKSALHVPIDKPLSKALLRKLILARISQISIKKKGL